MLKMMCVLVLCVPCWALCGDCRLDGQVNTLDVLLAAQVAAGLAPLYADGTPMSPLDMDIRACDVVNRRPPSDPPHIDILDALRIAQYSVGIGALICI